MMQAKVGLRIAIDGPSGSGKGTIAKKIGELLSLPVLDTGLLYRFVAWRAIELHVDMNDEHALLVLLADSQKYLSWRCEGIFFKEKDCTQRLRGEDVASQASVVAEKQGVRDALLLLQRSVAEAGCVMDGRDIGSVVLPEAEAKFFLTASHRERARRRWMQLQANGDDEVSLPQVLNDLKKRDARDEQRDCAPLVQSVDAILIDSTTMRADEVIDRIVAILERKGLLILNHA